MIMQKLIQRFCFLLFLVSSLNLFSAQDSTWFDFGVDGNGNRLDVFQAPKTIRKQ